MPRGDRTGPMKVGSMTGRGAGFCAGYGVPGFVNAMSRCGLHLSVQGSGRGWRHTFYATGLPGWMRLGYSPDPQQETSILKTRAESLKQELDAINKRIQDLESKV